MYITNEKQEPFTARAYNDLLIKVPFSETRKCTIHDGRRTPRDFRSITYEVHGGNSLAGQIREHVRAVNSKGIYILYNQNRYSPSGFNSFVRRWNEAPVKENTREITYEIYAPSLKRPLIVTQEHGLYPPDLKISDLSRNQLVSFVDSDTAVRPPDMASYLTALDDFLRDLDPVKKDIVTGSLSNGKGEIQQFSLATDFRFLNEVREHLESEEANYRNMISDLHSLHEMTCRRNDEMARQIDGGDFAEKLELEEHGITGCSWYVKAVLTAPAPLNRKADLQAVALEGCCRPYSTSAFYAPSKDIRIEERYLLQGPDGEFRASADTIQKLNPDLRMN